MYFISGAIFPLPFFSLMFPTRLKNWIDAVVFVDVVENPAVSVVYLLLFQQRVPHCALCTKH